MIGERKMKENEIARMDEIIETYSDMVYRIALNQMKNKDDAQDVFQEVFLRLVKYMPMLESKEHVKSWLIRVTINCSKSSLTCAWRRHTEPLMDMEGIVFESKEDQTVYVNLMSLPKKYRIVLYLFYYEELSVKEISEVTKQKETTVKSQLSRGRALLKKNLINLGGALE